MAKKKKTQLKPVARGFATTSVPKKVIPVEEEHDDSAANVQNESVEIAEATPNGGSVPEAQADEFDPDKVEEQSLQNLVDKLQDKTEKEIIRMVKAIEMDRRFAKTLPRLELDPALTERIIQAATDLEVGENRKPIDEPEDKAIARLGITYGVLRRLGFTELRVEECLRSIAGVDLEEAYSWLYIHCTEEELEQRGPSDIEGVEPKTPRHNRAHSTPQTPQTPHTPINPHTVAGTSKTHTRLGLDANAPIFIPSSPFLNDNRDRAAANSPSLDSGDDTFKNLEAGYESSDDDSDPNAGYVRLKLKIDEMSSKLGPGFRDTPLLQQYRRRVDALKQNYFFDEMDAEAAYRIERDKAGALALDARLRGFSDITSAPATKTKPVKQRPPHLLQSPPSGTVVDIFDEDTEESTGGILELLEDMPATEINEKGMTVKIRDMSLPKHWSGRTPKVLLAETVNKADRFAAITYQIISGQSRAKRAAVSIRWEGRKMDEWVMEDFACYDVAQAEQMIATIALHALTFPSTEGFSAGTSAAPGSQTFFRLLPAVFRDLWDELELARKSSDDAFNRSVWAKLRTIIEPKLENSEKAFGKFAKQAVDFRHPRSSRLLQNNDNLSELLMMEFRARQASANYQEMLVQRNQLPIALYKNQIVQSLEQSQILVLSGETGCGKSTQVPAFLLEDQLSKGRPCKIFCTEPRRISAISLAQRVSRELGDAPGAVGTLNSLVGYSIRLESNITRNTRLAFVTNGIALRMLEGGTGHNGQGTAFDEITHIIIDEVHERTIESDFLLIVLKSLLQQRSDLKVILMSATVDAEKISEFFGGCPMLHVPGRTFPVDICYLEDAVQYTKWSITESSPYARRLNDKFYRTKNRTDWSEETAAGDDDDPDDPDEKSIQENIKLEKRYSPSTVSTINLLDERLIPYDLIIKLLERVCFADTPYASYSSAFLIFMPGLGEIRRLNDLLAEHPQFGKDDFRIFPLHSTLSSDNIFDILPLGTRKIVIATNIAETGITIPDITCVIDTGKHREMRFDEKRQISRLVETFVAKSNAAQRRGRAGRVQRGLCFHLFTKLRHDSQMADHPLPEMMRLSLSDLALRIKIMRISLGASIEEVLSRALDPPASINVQRAISMLVEVRALTPSEEITPMGRLLSKLPTDVHLGKFLLIAAIFRCLDPALTIAAALNSKSPFISPFGLEQEADRAKSSFRTENSDFLTIHNAFNSWRRASANPSFVRKFCRVNFLSHQNLQQIEELRQQFLGYLIDTSFIQVNRQFIQELSRARYGRNRTRFVHVPAEYDRNSSNVALLNAALVAGLYPKVLAIDPTNSQMRTVSNNQLASFHPSSVNFRRKPLDFGVNYLAYFTLMHSKKLYAWETGPVDDMALLLLCGECEFKLISDSAFIDRKIRFHISPKANIALKCLRAQLNSLLAQQFRGKVLTESQIFWNDIALMVLGKSKVEEDAEGSNQQLAFVVNQ